MIVMEYIDGRPLGELLEGRPLPREQTAALARQVALGMAAAHAKGVVHGDLKPGNVMVTRDGAAKVMDFGLARRDPKAVSLGDTVHWGPAESSGISGTPSYMSPEQARGEAARAASDVFALGLILYEMLTGKQAVTGDNVIQALRRIEGLDAERYASEVPEPFAAVLRQALVTDFGRRTLTMARVAEMLA